MPTWPASLPQSPSAQGYAERPQSQVIRSQPDTGPAKQRRRFTAKVRKIPVSMMLDKSQLATFEAFFETDLAGGSLRFDWPQPRTGVTEQVRIIGDPPYELTALGNGVFWDLSFELEVLP